MDAYGVYRHVEYTAGEDGFKAVVKTNEPGTDNKDPADVMIMAEKPPAMTNPGSKSSGSGYGSGGGSGSGSDYGSGSGGSDYQSQEQSTGGSGYGENCFLFLVFSFSR